MAVKLRILVGF